MPPAEQAREGTIVFSPCSKQTESLHYECMFSTWLVNYLSVHVHLYTRSEPLFLIFLIFCALTPPLSFIIIMKAYSISMHNNIIISSWHGTRGLRCPEMNYRKMWGPVRIHHLSILTMANGWVAVNFPQCEFITIAHSKFSNPLMAGEVVEEFKADNGLICIHIPGIPFHYLFD